MIQLTFIFSIYSESLFYLRNDPVLLLQLKDISGLSFLIDRFSLFLIHFLYTSLLL